MNNKNSQIVEKLVEEFLTDLVFMIRKNAKKIVNEQEEIIDIIKNNLHELEWKYDFECLNSNEKIWYDVAFMLHFGNEKQFIPINLVSSKIAKMSEKTMEDEGLSFFMNGMDTVIPKKEFYLIAFDTNDIENNQSYWTSLNKLAKSEIAINGNSVSYKINDYLVISSKDYENQKNILLKASIGALFESEEFFKSLFEGVNFVGNNKEENSKIVEKFKESWEQIQKEDNGYNLN